MGKGRNFLQWGYATGRFALDPLREGLFHLVSGMQRPGKSSALVRDSLSYFGVESSEHFQELWNKLCEVVPVTVHGTNGSSAVIKCGPKHGAWVTWPSVFVHLCEAKQVLNALGQDTCELICRQSFRYPLPWMLEALMETGGVHDCFCLSLTKQMGALRTRITSKRPCHVWSDNASKKPRAVLPLDTRACKHAKRNHTTDHSDGVDQATNGSAKDDKATDHGAGVDQATNQDSELEQTKQVTVRCACSGMCAKGAPMCPGRCRFYQSSVKGLGCPNPAQVLDPSNQRHFCSSCRCRAPGFLVISDMH